MLLVSTVIHPGGFPGVGWGDQKLKDMEWHFCSQNTYRVRLDDSEQDRFFAASEREKKNKQIYTTRKAQTQTETACFWEEMCVACWQIFPWASRAERMKQLRRGLQNTEQPAPPIKCFLTAANHPTGRFISRFYQPFDLYDQATGRLNQTR